VLFYVQSDDDLVQPDACRALFHALGSTDKTLVENPGGHLDLLRTSVEESAVWLDRKLAEQAAVPGARVDEPTTVVSGEELPDEPGRCPLQSPTIRTLMR